MILAVTGTPGTGKTAVSRAVAEELDYRYVDVNEVVGQADVTTEEDLQRGATAVAVDSLIDVLQSDLDDDTVLDGHLSHHYPADLTVVLRCQPAELRERLQGKGWNEEKVQENVAAERVDVILQEAVAARDRVAEIDTTERDPDHVAAVIADAVASGTVPDRLQPGTVSWPVTEHSDENG
ncbi:MAG: adenylate kinase family protein [Candidatus Nanohaloarchaea archaeon]|nr:adenylate kinase family protein [Candidatus Nanohaloarchaea archaeon]